MKKNIIGGLSAAVLSLAIVQAAPVYAMHQPDHKKGQCIMQKLERLKASLALTPDQEKQLQGVRENNKDFMKKMREEKHVIKKEAHVIADAEQVDQAKLDKLAKRAGQLAGEKLKHRVMTKHEINQILTQEQKDKLKKDKGNMQKKMMHKKVTQ